MNLGFSSEHMEFQFIDPEHEAIESVASQKEVNLSHIAEVKGTYIVSSRLFRFVLRAI
jgi:hypothetical protein